MGNPLTNPKRSQKYVDGSGGSCGICQGQDRPLMEVGTYQHPTTTVDIDAIMRSDNDEGADNAPDTAD